MKHLFVQHCLLLCAFICSVIAKGHGIARNDTFKHQYCLDPRTQQRHAAYSEWADAYSCSRHRCRPGTHKLAIYTVGCKQVEPPESAIECEQVVEDTNMQFPYCCTRLRCLVVVRGEVWTKVLGQPWESLPAAPWSHMYKMKRAPPDESSRPNVEGPVYELSELTDREDEDRGGPGEAAVMRSKRSTTPPPAATADCDQPDIVIAVQTGDSKNTLKKMPGNKRFELRNSWKESNETDYVEGIEDFSDENSDRKRNQLKPTTPRQLRSDQEDLESDVTDKPEVEFRDLVSRMQEVETAVLRMSEKEPRPETKRRPKRPGQDHGYKRFKQKGRGKKSLRRPEKPTSEMPMFVEDANLSGYFSDADDARRANVIKSQKPPQQMYVAPVEPHKGAPAEPRKGAPDSKKRNKKKRRRRSRKRTLSAESRRRRLDRLNSLELEAASLENGSETSLGYK